MVLSCVRCYSYCNDIPQNLLPSAVILFADNITIFESHTFTTSSSPRELVEESRIMVVRKQTLAKCPLNRKKSIFNKSQGKIIFLGITLDPRHIELLTRERLLNQLYLLR